MKTPILSTVSSIMYCALMFMACRPEQVQQFNVDLQYSDGSKESYAMFPGSIVLVHRGDMNAVIKAISGNDKELELQVTRFTTTIDSIKRERTIQKAGAKNEKISVAKNASLDPTGAVQVKLESVAMIDTGRRPKGACGGNCCEAKCFSTFCCTDPDECKSVPCDCKPPSNCPGQPTPDQTAHFFELFLSGKDVLVFKN